MAQVLLVDDDGPVRTFVRRALELDGHGVTEAADGEDGLKKLVAAQGVFELVITDIQMPGMDGIALAGEIARHDPALPILVMTGYAHQRERALQAHGLVRDVLLKPFTLTQLRETVQAALLLKGA